MAPLPPPVPTTMARHLPLQLEHEPPAEFSTSAPSRRFVRTVSGTGSQEEAFYTIVEDLHFLVVRIHAKFHRWQQRGSIMDEYSHVTEDLLASCDRIEWKVLRFEKTLSVASRDPTIEVELSGRREWTRSARNQVANIRSAIEKAILKSAILTVDDLRRIIHRSSQDSNDSISSELYRQLLPLRQQDGELDEIRASVLPPLDKKRTITVMKGLSTSVLTMIAALSTYSSDTVAPLARGMLAQEVLLISPFVCVPVALIGAALSFCASESNGLADCASMVVLLVCLSGIGLGASAVIIILHAAHLRTVLWTCLLTLTIIGAWGWLFAYPQCLKFNWRMMFWEYFDRRRSTKPQREACTNPGTSQYADQKGFRRMLSNSFAACQRAFIPLNEDKTIDLMKTVSPTLLTAISALSLWAAQTVAPQAYHSVTLQMFLYTLPYFYLPLVVVAIALALAASKSNGLASYASVLGLVLCSCGIALGACCSIVIFHFGLPLSELVAGVLILALTIIWGWMLAYPKMLNFTIRKTFCMYCARRLRIFPLGGFDCGRNSCAWAFRVLKVISRNMVFFLRIRFAVCLRNVRAWWNNIHGHIAGVELDLESGLQLIPVAVPVEP